MGRTTYSIKKILTILCIFFIGALLVGCGSAEKAATKEDRSVEEAQRYEAGFRPSEFDPDPRAILENEVSNRPDSILSPDEELQNTMELISGFRVQIFSSNSIDDANAAKEAAQAKFTQESFYLVYDPPTYKLRGGDFHTRFEADRFAKLLRESGHKDAWVVPEKVFKTPPQRLQK